MDGNVLVVDDPLIALLKDTERRDLFEISGGRDRKQSTMIASQLPTKKCHKALSDPTLADAICDRFVHSADLLVSTLLGRERGVLASASTGNGVSEKALGFVDEAPAAIVRAPTTGWCGATARLALRCRLDG
jgi:hypothetical protein